jgi:hypothetical protein
MTYVVEGVSVFSHIYAPDENFERDSYTLYFNADDKTMLRFAEKEVDIKAIHYTTGEDVYCVRMSCRASYADQVLAPPPIFDKDNNPFVLTAEIPRYHPVKVKFEIQKGAVVLRSKYFLIIKAIQLLEDIPSPFENVENF